MVNSFSLHNFHCQCGIELRSATLVYKTYGRLNTKRNNVVLYPTSYGAQHSDVDWLVRPGSILDPTDWFVVMPNMFGKALLHK